MAMVSIHNTIFSQRPYFFDQGICFECQQCGACCTGDPGTVYVSGAEIEAIGAYLQMQPADFISRYLYRFKDSFSILEDTQGRCLFFDNDCTIYAVRPVQCRTFPFWFSNLRSEKRWALVQRQCPGIGRGPCYTKAQIMAIAQTAMDF